MSDELLLIAKVFALSFSLAQRKRVRKEESASDNGRGSNLKSTLRYMVHTYSKHINN